MINLKVGIHQNSLTQTILNKKGNQYYDYYPDKEFYLYDNKFFNPKHGDGGRDYFESQGVTYHFNSDGMRSPEFPNIDMLTAGCSVTFGEGLDIDKVWHQVISQKTGLTVGSLGMPGASAYATVRRVFAYFEKYGNPKYLFCLFPEFARLEIFDNSHQLTFKRHETHKKPDMEYPNVRGIIVEDPERKSKIAKAPFIADDIFSLELAHFYNMQAIRMLNQYCKSNNIKFAWTTWMPEHEVLVQKLGEEYFPNYISIDICKWQFDYESKIDIFYENNIIDYPDAKQILCHQDIKDTTDQFEYANDVSWDSDNKMRAHWGYHRHIHFAEIIYDYIKKEWLND